MLCYIKNSQYLQWQAWKLERKYCNTKLCRTCYTYILSPSLYKIILGIELSPKKWQELDAKWPDSFTDQ